jgi:predicted DNA-binding protein (MmcQ/YjbR family)
MPLISDKFRDRIEKYAEITPGYHLNKTHWSSMLLGGNVPEEVLKKSSTARMN